MLNVFKTNIANNLKSNKTDNRRIKLILDLPCMSRLQQLIYDTDNPDLISDDLVYDNSTSLLRINVNLLSLLVTNTLCNKDIESLDENEKENVSLMNSLIDEFLTILDKMLSSYKEHELSVNNIVDIHYINLYGLLYIEFDKTADDDNNIFTNIIVNNLNEE